MCPFKSDFCVDSKLFGKRINIAWRGDHPPKLSISLSTSPAGAKTARIVEQIPFYFDTGATWTNLEPYTAGWRGLDLNLEWSNENQLDALKIADDSIYVCLRQAIEVQLGDRWYRINARAPIRYAADEDTQIKRAEAVAALKRKGLISNQKVVFELVRNVLGLTDMLEDFLLCLSKEGLYLFPRRRKSIASKRR